MPESKASSDQLWTTRRLLAWMNRAFADKQIDAPRLCAEMLLAHVLGCDRLKLYTDPDRPASPLERSSLRELVARALKHEPIQYLIEEAWFFGLAFHVDRRVLIPRPCTEIIVEHVLQHARSHPGFGGTSGESLLIADVCTGSGCIAVALARHLAHARVIATDISRDALDVARLNAQRHGVADRIDLRLGNLLAPILEHPAAGRRAALSYICANPPYIPDNEWAKVEPNVRDHEPESALRGGPDGLAFVRPIIESAAPLLRSGGLLLVEIASVSADEVVALTTRLDAFDDVSVVNDAEGKPRTLIARRAH
ncbi:MAG: peptide chain release factor N(5)-glutamine methyltransferase [Planctomycetota bacterium]|nr:MAG: peptide chain release factor N(5)-glutamine methyltransferase [Planctomycetota bacterium]